MQCETCSSPQPPTTHHICILILCEWKRHVFLKSPFVHSTYCYILQLEWRNVMLNIVSPTEHCYGSEYAWLVGTVGWCLWEKEVGASRYSATSDSTDNFDRWIKLGYQVSFGKHVWNTIECRFRFQNWSWDVKVYERLGCSFWFLVLVCLSGHIFRTASQLY